MFLPVPCILQEELDDFISGLKTAIAKNIDQIVKWVAKGEFKWRDFNDNELIRELNQKAEPLIREV